MIRTQIYIPDDLHRDLTLLAKSSGVNFSQLIREGAEEVKKKRAVVNKKKDWRKFIGAGGRGGPKDLSSKIDDYLYGEKNLKWAGR